MRCKNCGWENPDGQAKCEKCHSDMGVESRVNEHNPTTPVSDRMKSTVAEGIIFNDVTPQAGTPKTCPKCGYPLSDSSTSCPNCNHELVVNPTKKQSVKCKSCGAEVSEDHKFCPECGTSMKSPVNNPRRIQRSNMGTVMGGPISGGSNNVFCTLKPIAWEGENVNYNPITYSGESIILNRANTDANNNSITSREQAVLTFEDGSWYIENRSDLRSTFIRVNDKIKLSDGDIIILGNREFEFKG